MTLRILVTVAIVCGASLASADPPRTPPTADAKQQAAAHYDRARSAYSFGNYDVAIREYQAAFDLTGAAEYVFNIAQTYRAKGDKRLALDSYKKYIELDPEGDGVAPARAHIESMEKELREIEQAELGRKTQAEAERRRVEEAMLAAQTARREAVLLAKRRTEEDAAHRKSTSRYLRIAGLAAGGTGLATLGASAFFGYRARTASHDASGVNGMWTEEAQRSVARAESSQRTMWILLGTGGAAAVTGGVLYMVGAQRKAEPTRQILVTPGPTGGAQVWFEGRF